jgi:hypothetical protein
MIVDQHLADLVIADEHFREALGRVAEGLHGAAHERLRGEGGERRLLRRFPHHRIAAHEGERRVPGPDGDRKVEGRDDPAHPEGVPGLQHAMVDALGGYGQAIELARQADGEVADVDHLLHLADALGQDLSRLDGDEAAEVRLCGAQLFPEKPHEFAAPGGRHPAPGQERLVGAADGGLGFLRRGAVQAGDGLAVNRGAGRDALIGESALRHPKTADKGARLVSDRGLEGCGGRDLIHEPRPASGALMHSAESIARLVRAGNVP